MYATLIEKILERDYTGANEEFEAIMGDKIAEALETEKVLVAAESYSGISRDEILEAKKKEDDDDEDEEDDDDDDDDDESEEDDDDDDEKDSKKK